MFLSEKNSYYICNNFDDTYDIDGNNYFNYDVDVMIILMMIMVIMIIIIVMIMMIMMIIIMMMVIMN